MPSKAASKLFRSHRKQIACAIARQIQQAVPPYRDVDALSLARNVDGVLKAVQRLLAGEDERAVFEVLDALRAQRLQHGFSESDFLVAVLCGLPVIRRFFANRASSIEVGMRFFEEIEAILIPLYGQWVASDISAFEDTATDPDHESPFHNVATEPSAGAEQLLNFRIVTIEEIADDPVTLPFIEAS